MSTNHRQVTRSAGVIGAFTSLSRVLGFIRDMVIAAAFGTGVAAEAFVVSFKIPNLLRDLVGEGATNAAFVPVMTECREKRPDQFWRLVATLFWTMGAILLLLSLAGIFFTPQIVALIAPGFLQASEPDKYPLTVQLTRTIFPYLLLIGLSALAMGVLNTLKEFKTSAFGPALLNLCLIIAGVFFEKKYGPMALVIGVLLGGVLQLACQLPPVFKSGFKFFPAGAQGGYGRKIGKLLLPRAFGSALYQINVFVDSILASFEKFVGVGGQSALYYSNRLFQLPLAIFGVAMAQALLPTFSSQMVRKDKEGFRDTFSMAVRSLMFIVVPASVGLIVLCEPIVRILFQTGRFDEHSTQITASALFYYSFGLMSCCFIKILVNAFYAMQDTRTPVKTMLLSVGFNVLMSLWLMHPLKLGGLALASSLSATLNCVLLYRVLRLRMGDLGEVCIWDAARRILAASVVLALAAYGLASWILPQFASSGRALQFGVLFGGIAICGLLYYVAALVFRVPEARKLFS